MSLSSMNVVKIKRDSAFDIKNQKNLDYVNVTTKKGTERLPIPARPGSIYWGIYTVMYRNIDRRVYLNQLFSEIKEVMMDRYPDRWEKYANKKEVTSISDGVANKKEANSCSVRLFKNIKNLCRLGGDNAYGKRLLGRKHVLRHEKDEAGKDYFILYSETNSSNTKIRTRGRPRKKV